MPFADPLLHHERDLGCRHDIEHHARPHVDGVIAVLAARQHGVVSRAQLLAAGATPGEITLRVRRRRLHPLHPGVYAAGHSSLTQKGRWMAAVLAAGPGAVLSHRAAAALHRLLSSSAVEVTVTKQKRATRFTTHRGHVPADERTMVDGIPVTTAARTILDLAATAPEHLVEKAMHEAEVNRLGGRLSLDDLLYRYPRRRGSAKVCGVLARGRIGLDVTKSELEDRFLRLLDARGLERPLRNEPVEGFTVDCVWSQQRLIVELDSRGVHGTTKLFESDRARDRRLVRAGWTVIRITWRMLVEDATGVLDDLTALLRRRARAR